MLTLNMYIKYPKQEDQVAVEKHLTAMTGTKELEHHHSEQTKHYNDCSFPYASPCLMNQLRNSFRQPNPNNSSNSELIAHIKYFLSQH